MITAVGMEASLLSRVPRMRATSWGEHGAHIFSEFARGNPPKSEGLTSREKGWPPPPSFCSLTSPQNLVTSRIL